MKTYEVIIDLGSHHFNIEADNLEEAKEEAVKQFTNMSDVDKSYDWWVAEVNEVEK